MEIKASARAESGKVRLCVQSRRTMLNRRHQFTLGPVEASKLGLALLDAAKKAERQKR